MVMQLVIVILHEACFMLLFTFYWSNHKMEGLHSFTFLILPKPVDETVEDVAMHKQEDWTETYKGVDSGERDSKAGW